MKPYYQDKWATIYNCDCRDILPELGGGIDMVITSPPYNVGLDYGEYQDNRLDFREFINSVFTALYPVCAEKSRLYVAISEEMIYWFKPMMEEIGWNYGQLLVWCKPNICSSKKISGDWNYMTDWFQLFRKGKRVPMLNNGRARTFNWFDFAYPQSNFKNDKKYHPAQWPIKLIKTIISRTPGDLILDCFMGSGTVLVAAAGLERKAIGIEINEKYCELAAKRLQGIKPNTAQEVMELNI